VLLGGFCKSCGFSGFKSCGFGGFLWYFSGVFSTCGSSSRLICGSSSRFLRYLWWKSPTRCIWCMFGGFRVPCLSNDALPMTKTAIRDHFSIAIYPILIHKTALRIVIWLSWRLEPSNTSKIHTCKLVRIEGITVVQTLFRVDFCILMRGILQYKSGLRF